MMATYDRVPGVVVAPGRSQADGANASSHRPSAAARLVLEGVRQP